MAIQVDWTRPPDQRAVLNAFAALFALAIAAKAFSLQLRVGAATTSVSFAPYLAAVIMLPPLWAMALAGIAELAAETLIRRKPGIKVAHNAAKEVVAVGAASFLYVELGGVAWLSDFGSAFSIPGFVVASLAYFTIGNGSTAVAVSLSTPTDFRDAWTEIVNRGFIQNLFSSSLAPLLAFLYMELGVLGLILVLVPLALVRHSEQANLRLDQANQDLLELMVKSIEARDPYTSGHSLRVATYAKALARSVGLSGREVEQIEKAALLHDVGKIYEEFAPLLRKDTRLSPDERFLMQSHPVRSAELVGAISSLRGYVEKCVRHHHENYDGGGYPDGLAGDDIPLGARIIMIADTADAMTTDRPYRRALGYDDVVRELEAYAGSQFDPRLVETFQVGPQIRRLIEDRVGSVQRYHARFQQPLPRQPRRHPAERVPELSA